MNLLGAFLGFALLSGLASALAGVSDGLEGGGIFECVSAETFSALPWEESSAFCLRASISNAAATISASGILNVVHHSPANSIGNRCIDDKSQRLKICSDFVGDLR